MSGRLAIVHERFTGYHGSEKVVAQLVEQWPGASLFSPLVFPDQIPAAMRTAPRSGRFGQAYAWTRIPTHGLALPVLPAAFRHLPIGDVDAVLVSHHSFATQVVHATAAPVAAYVHSPARWAWEPDMRAGEWGGRLGSLALDLLARRTRQQERSAAEKLRLVVANSHAVADRIRRFWGRDVDAVVPPPVDVDFYTPDPSLPREPFILLAGRLAPYKRPERAVRAASIRGIPLVVAGEGRAMPQCRAAAGSSVRFVGRVDDVGMRDLMRRCRAVVMPGIEDFGIIPVESMACGTPVIALDAGGALDSVVDGVTGHLVPLQDEDAMMHGFAEAMQAALGATPDIGVLRDHAERFSAPAFRERMSAVMQPLLA